MVDENKKHKHKFNTDLKLRFNNIFSQPSFVFDKMTDAGELVAFSMVKPPFLLLYKKTKKDFVKLCKGKIYIFDKREQIIF